MRNVLVVLPVLLGLSAASACDRAGEADAFSEDASPEYGGTVVIGGPTDLGPLNPITAAEETTRDLLEHALFLTLVRYDSVMQYQPRLAESWEIEGDTAVVFHLRRDVLWHDSVPTTAGDVVFTFRRATDPETGYPDAARLAGWSDPEAVDSFTVRFRVDRRPELLSGWVNTGILPEHLLSDVPAVELRRAEFNQHPIGNGPFRFIGSRANDRTELAANRDFPEALGGRPYLDRLVYRVIPEALSQYVELTTGDVDVLLHVPVTEVERLRDESSVRVADAATGQFAFIGWNGRRAPFDDPRVRRALALAVDRERMVRVLRRGYGQPAAGPVPPIHWGFPEDVEPLPHDTAAARRLLAEAGWTDRDDDGLLEGPDGQSLTIELKYPGQDPVFGNAAELIESDLGAIGATVELRPTEGSTLVEDVTSAERRFDAFLLSWTSDFQLDLRDTFHSSSAGGPFQFAGYGNPEVDRLIDSLAVATDREDARPQWRRVQRILRDEQPWTFLYYFPALAAVSSDIGGVRMDARGRLVTLPEWHLRRTTASAPPPGD